MFYTKFIIPAMHKENKQGYAVTCGRAHYDFEK